LLFIANGDASANGTLIKGDMANKFLAIGKADVTLATEDATLQVYPTATNDSAYFAKMPASHTGDLIRIENSSGTALFKVDKDGDMTVGGGWTFDSVGITAIQTSGESFADNDTSLMTSAAVADKIEGYGYGVSSELNDLDDVSYGGTNLTKSLLINNAPGSAPTTGTLGSDCSYNLAIGDAALNSITDATQNVALGRSALTALTTGDNNIGIGQYAGAGTTSGYDNIAIGINCIKDGANVGYHNIALGTDALGDLTGGYHNIALGNGALEETDTGFANISMGLASLKHNNDGSYNIAIGVSALQGHADDTAGNTFNIGIGRDAGRGTTTGDRNIFIGSYAGYGWHTSASDMLFIANSYESSGGTLIKGDMANKFLAIGKADVTLTTEDATLQVYPDGTNDSAYFAKMPGSHTGDLIRIHSCHL